MPELLNTRDTPLDSIALFRCARVAIEHRLTGQDLKLKDPYDNLIQVTPDGEELHIASLGAEGRRKKNDRSLILTISATPLK